MVGPASAAWLVEPFECPFWVMFQKMLANNNSEQEYVSMDQDGHICLSKDGEQQTVYRVVVEV